MRAWAAISTAIGWTYFLAWSVSFYPQLILNWRRKAVTGLSLDYVVLNILGFACYSIYTVAFLSSSALNKEYKQRHPDSSGSAVRANDAVFAIHAFILSCAILCQACFLGYERAPGQMISLVTKGFLCGSAALMAMLISLVWLKSVEWIDVVYVLSYIKLSISFIKMPAQLLLNYKRQSTIGWSIVVPLLDLLGGVLSLLRTLSCLNAIMITIDSRDLHS